MSRHLSRRQAVSGLSVAAIGALAATPTSGQSATAFDPAFSAKCEAYWKAKAAANAKHARIDAALARLGPPPATKAAGVRWKVRMHRIESTNTPEMERLNATIAAAVLHPVFTLAEVVEKIRMTDADETFECGGEEIDAMREAIFSDVLAIAGEVRI